MADVERDAVESDTVVTQDLRVTAWQKIESSTLGKVFKVPHGKVRLNILADNGSVAIVFVFANLPDGAHAADYFLNTPPEGRVPPTTATEVIHAPGFQTLFGDQIVSKAARFSVGRVVLVFTDVVSSTALYGECGDGPALDAVRKHFEILFAAFGKRGRIVKTVGDAVMGSFTSGQAAIRAVAEGLQQMKGRIQRPSGGHLTIRVGIHAGSALMVPLNGINDYFGTTCNIAARVESKAHDGECLVSEAVLKDAEASQTFEELIGSEFRHTRDVDLTLKGVERIVKARGFTYGHAP